MGEKEVASMGKKTALLLGATGLVGKALLEELLAEPAYERVIVWGRRPTGRVHEKLLERTIELELIPIMEEEKVTDVFCCLGTTIRKAGSRDAFRQVDYGYPVSLGEWALQHGAERMLVVSAMGADPGSRVFYSRTKGEMEQALSALGLPLLFLFRPSLLLGDREERRFGEELAARVSKALPFLYAGPFRRYRPVPGQVVAMAMNRAAQEGHAAGVQVLPSAAIHRMAETNS